MIKAIILDFGGVVFQNKLKEKWDGEKDQLKVSPNLWEQATLGKINDEKVFEDIAQNYNVSAREIKDWLFSRREPNQKLLDLLGTVKSDIKKAIINNGLKTLFRGFLTKYNLALKFDALINSAEEGVKKPDPKIYLDTCQKLGVKPEECIFIDDDYDNIKGAADLGMKTIFFSNIQSLKDEFTKWGIENEAEPLLTNRLAKN